MIMLDALLIICALLLLAACIGLIRFPEQENIIYARLHIAGVIDVVCIALTLILGYPLIAAAYFILMPLTAHSIANARYMRGGFG